MHCISIKLLEILIPGEDRIQEREKIEDLDYELINAFPEGAIKLANRQTMQMADLVLESLETGQNYLKTKDDEDIDVIHQLEEIVNSMDADLTRYLLEIAKQSGSSGDIAEDFSSSLDVVKNIERIGDISVNIAEFYEKIYENREEFSSEAIEDLQTMYHLVFDMLKRSFKIFTTANENDIPQLLQDEEYMDLIEEKYREKHFRRMAEGICDGQISSSVYVDILGSMERIGDHAVNIVENMKKEL